MNAILLPSKKANTVPNLKSGIFSVKILLIVSLVANFFTQASAQCANSAGSSTTALWTGAVSSDWCNSANWACGIMPSPDGTMNTVIPANAANMPVVTCTFSFNAFTANLDVAPGATLTIPSSRTLNINGNFLNKDESRYVLNGRVNFSGQNQVIPGFTYNNLTVSGGGVKTLSSSAQVNGALILTKGVIETSNNSLLTLGAKGLVTAGYSTSYIDGPFRRLTNSSRTYNFPVGEGGVVRTVLISPEADADGAYTVTYHHSVAPNNGTFGCTNLMANEEATYWEVAKSGNAANALVQMDYINPNNPKGWSNKRNPGQSSNVALIQNTKGSWAFNGDASRGLQSLESLPWEVNGQLSTKLQADFSYFTFGYGYDVILPINLLTFSAKLQAATSQVSFSLEQDNDIVVTELQHSLDEKHFEKLSTVDAGKAIVYNYAHNNLKAGAHYYRLLMTDKARNISHSKTVTVVVPDYVTRIKGLKATLVRYEASVKVESAREQMIGINVFDMAGHLVSKEKVNIMTGENFINVKTMMITPGIYNMYVQTADGVAATLRFMKE